MLGCPDGRDLIEISLVRSNGQDILHRDRIDRELGDTVKDVRNSDRAVEKEERRVERRGEGRDRENLLFITLSRYISLLASECQCLSRIRYQLGY